MAKRKKRRESYAKGFMGSPFPPLVGGCEDKSSLSRSGKEARGGGGRREKGEGRSGSV
jgi:hypothetical protein